MSIETRVRVNGEWTTRSMAIDDLVEDANSRPSRNTAPKPQMPHLGLLTQTIAPSPVIRWVFRANVRCRGQDDVIFVGEDFVHVKEIMHGGHLRTVATKTDFDCRIQAACILGQDKTVGNGPEELKPEYKDDLSQFPNGTRPLPPHVLVLVLETQRLYFMFLFEDQHTGAIFEFSYIQPNVPLPRSDGPLRQVGKHLAADPFARAVAVAASEDTVLLYCTRNMENLRHETARWERGFLPVSREQAIQKVPGVIVKMDFLFPSKDSPDHIILLLVVIQDRKTKLVRIEWSYSDIGSVAIHHGQRIHTGEYENEHPTLLIPLQSRAAFILASGTDLVLYTDLLSGHAEAKALGLPRADNLSPGSSACFPRYASWARAPRNLDALEDCLYVAREDGALFYLAINKIDPKVAVLGTHAGYFHHRTEAPFACFGFLDTPDTFAVPGSMSRGGIYSAGMWRAKEGEVDWETDRRTAMSLAKSEPLANWSPVIDMIPVPRKNLSSNDTLFSTAGQQPDGNLVEIRHGYEGRSGFKFELEDIGGVTSLLALPAFYAQRILLLMSSPTHSTLLSLQRVESEEEPLDVELLDLSGFDLARSTIAAAVLQDGLIVQITDSAICVATPSGEKCAREDCTSGEQIIAASISEMHCVAITAVRTEQQVSLHLFHIIPSSDNILHHIGHHLRLDSHPLCMEIFGSGDSLYTAVGTSKASVQTFRLHHQEGIIPFNEHIISHSDVELNACEDVVILGSSTKPLAGNPSAFLAVCALRNGDMYTVELSLTNTTAWIEVISTSRLTLDVTSARLTKDSNNTNRAFATAGPNLYSIEWNASNPQPLSIHHVWITDQNDPSAPQPHVSSTAVLPSENFLSGDQTESIAVTYGDTCSIVQLDRNVDIVTRSLQVAGTPSRVIHSKHFGYLVSASLEIKTRSMPRLEQPKIPGRRSIRPVVEFVPVGEQTWRHTEYMNPGERVYSLMEWVYTYKSVDLPKPKVYAFFMVGKGINNGRGSAKGEIVFLQPTQERVKDKEYRIKEVRRGKTMAFDEPVYSLALYTETEFVACSGSWIFLYRWQAEERKWIQVCKHRLSTPGMHVTTAAPLIHVTTSGDSLVTFEVTTTATTTTSDREPQTILKPICMDTEAVYGAYHLTLTIPTTPTPSDLSVMDLDAPSLSVNILTTRTGTVIGRPIPPRTSHRVMTSYPSLFSASLTRSLTRIHAANICPPWKPHSHPGILCNNLVGTSVDGSVMGLAVLDEELWRRLRWLQTLCERSGEICPFAERHALQDFRGERQRSQHSHLPMGFSGVETDGDGGHARQAERFRHQDMHINGDVLKRLLERGAEARLREMLGTEARVRKDKVADWVRENLDAELRCVDDAVADLRRVLDQWF